MSPPTSFVHSIPLSSSSRHARHCPHPRTFAPSSPPSTLSPQRPPMATPVRTPPSATVAAPAPPSAQPPPSNTPNTLQPSPSPPTTTLPPTAPFAHGILHDIATPAAFDALQAQAAAENRTLIVDFMARWCRKCKYLLPRLRKLAAKHSDTTLFCTVDVNAVERLPRQFAITKMPTFVVIQNNTPVHTFIGGAEAPRVASHLDILVDKFSK